MFDESMIAGRHLTLGPRGAAQAVRMRVRLPWYRSLPLSCIEGLELEMDGERVAEERLALRINGHDHPMAEVPALCDVWWFVLDALELVAATRTELGSGAHRVGLTLRLRIPYGDPDYRDIAFVQVARCVRQMGVLGTDA